MGSSPAYPSDLTDAQWALIEPLVPVRSTRGKGTRGGRPPKVPRRRIVDAILYLDRTGCSWRQLPHDFPPWDTVYFYFSRWAADGTVDRIHDALRNAVRDAAGRDPMASAGAVDSQTVPGGSTVGKGSRGWDAGKKTNGRKRYLVVDTLGLLIVVLVTAASVRDRDGAVRVLETAVRDGALTSNPAAVIRRPRVTSKEAPHLTPPQVAELLQAAEGSRYAPRFALLVHTGLRRGEALALQWSDVDLTKGVLRVRGTLSRVDGELLVTEPRRRSPSASCRSPHLPSGCSATCTPLRLKTVPGPARRGARPGSCLPRKVASTAIRGTPSAHSKSRQRGPAYPTSAAHPPNTLRHSAASVMLTHGVPLTVVSEVLGHSSIAITGDVYGHVAPDVSRDALDILGDVLGR